MFRRVRALDFIDDMLAINSSLPVRQGRPMDTAYLDRQQVRSFCEHAGELYGVLSSDGKLAAYAHVPICGDVARFSRLLGHEAYLKNATMYLLVAESVREMIRIDNTKRIRFRWHTICFLGRSPVLLSSNGLLGSPLSGQLALENVKCIVLEIFPNDTHWLDAPPQPFLSFGMRSSTVRPESPSHGRGSRCVGRAARRSSPGACSSRFIVLLPASGAQSLRLASRLSPNNASTGSKRTPAPDRSVTYRGR